MNCSLKKRLLNGDKLTGCWVSMFNSIAAEILANAGYDTAIIDLEHGPGSFLDAITIMQALEYKGCSPVIRTTSSNITDIKRTLDIGPKGIMVPNIRNVKEAEAVVRHCRYGPAGDRGAAPGYIRANNYHGSKDLIENYQAYMREDFLLIVQIESAEAVRQLEKIVEIDGIDMIFIGPADLSSSLGKLGDFASKEFIEAFSRIESVCLNAGKLLGTIPFSNWDPARLYRNGHQLVVSGSDSMLLAQAAGEDRRLLSKAIISAT